MMSLVQAQQGEPRKKTVLDGLFSIQSEGLVWNHDAVVYVIAVGVWHHASACIFLRIDYIHHFVMMPYRRQAADFIHGFAVIYELQFRPMRTKQNTRHKGGCFVLAPPAMLVQRYLSLKVTARSEVTGNVFACKNLPHGVSHVG